MSAQAPHRPLELARLAAGHLAERGVEDPRLDAELLLAHVLGVRRLDLYLQFERPLTPDEVAAYREAIRRRGQREPLQYITGTTSFRELELAVDPRVLIPRPETEVLVGAVLEWAAGRGDLVALDIGTGSGAIALSLLAEGPFARMVATDVSRGALELAAENARRTGLDARLELRHGPLWEPIGDGERFDVIVSNPPYVADAEGAGLQPEVAAHEPAGALFAGLRYVYAKKIIFGAITLDLFVVQQAVIVFPHAAFLVPFSGCHGVALLDRGLAARGGGHGEPLALAGGDLEVQALGAAVQLAL